MYMFLILVLLAAGAAAASHGASEKRKWEVALGIGLIAATAIFFGLLSLWGELLWFRALGYGDRFWTAIAARIGFSIFGALLGGALVKLLVWPSPRGHAMARFWPEAVGAVLGGLWGLSNWAVILKHWHSAPTGVHDPIFDRDVSFFLFTLPLYDSVGWLLFGLALIAVVAALVALLEPERLLSSSRSDSLLDFVDLSDRAHPGTLRRLQIAGGALALALAWRFYVGAFDLMYSQYGVVQGPGWTDVRVRLPAYYIMAGALVIAALALAAPAVAGHFRGTALSRRQRLLTTSPLAAAALVWLIGLVLLPGVFQWLYVQPNEVSVEKPYIEHNIRFTRQAFQLDDVEEREFPVAPQFTEAMVESNREVLDQVRLWDPRALDEVYEQFQEIRLYYEFIDVDIDRYTIDGKYQQVMVSPREMALNNLPDQSQTFVNRRFKYTHGFGLTMAPVNEFTQGGLPKLLIKDLPPQSTSPDLTVRRPEIYYGELTNTHVLVNTEEKEFDYPSGEHNVYTRYSGRGGVELSNLWRKFIFGWMFDGTRLFVSGYPTSESRIQFHRQIYERVRMLAPFLDFDEDAYVVLDDGKLYWIIDGYTASGAYPYSEPFSSSEVTSYGRDRRRRPAQSDVASYLRGANYVRNSVKAVVDAFHGTVDFYVYEPDDPLIQVWQGIFPDLFKPKESMPASLQAHVRYPEGLLLAQGLVYARYHMTDPDVFYNQEDVWVRATEKYYANVQPVQPYYVMWQPPAREEGGKPEFILMQPFTPKNRQVLIGWIAGMCDGENYGRLLAYRFPKDERVLGTQQVETKIDQDADLSEQLSLWDQRGSRVVRGNVLVIPVEDTLLYVEPIYLRAEAAAYPELRLVAVMHDDQLSYADNFEDALRGIYSADEPRPPTRKAAPLDGALSELVRRAGDAFDGYLDALSEKDFDAANERLKALSATLEQLKRLEPNGEPKGAKNAPRR